MVPKKLLVTGCIVGSSLYQNKAGQEVVWGGERVEPGEMRWCRQSNLIHLLKSFLELYEHDVERVRYCPQHPESVNMKTFDTRMVSQNGSMKGMSLGSAAPTTPPPPPALQATAFSFLTLFFSPFPRLWLSKFGQWEIETQCTIWMHMNYEW